MERLFDVEGSEPFILHAQLSTTGDLPIGDVVKVERGLREADADNATRATIKDDDVVGRVVFAEENEEGRGEFFDGRPEKKRSKADQK